MAKIQRVLLSELFLDCNITNAGLNYIRLWINVSSYAYCVDNAYCNKLLFNGK